MAEKPSYEFVEVKASDILAERQSEWAGFTTFMTWATGAVVTILVLVYLIWG